ncbi:MAG: alpha-amylase family protein [Thermoleophilia bacterium]|nr:alpha-amylase family protein [Thermoleophilia bacterium]
MATTARSKARRRSKAAADATAADSTAADTTATAAAAADATGSTIDERVRVGARRRVVLEAAAPEVDAGRFPAKRVVGDVLLAEVDAFGDGHDHVAGVVRFRHEADEAWTEAPLRELGNDRWVGEVPLTRQGRWHYTFEAWVDHWDTWRSDLAKRVEAGQDVAVDLQIGASHVRAAAQRASDASRLEAYAAVLERGGEDAVAAALGDELDKLMRGVPDRTHAATYDRVLDVVVDRERARFSSWYERFPRSASPDPKRPGTLQDLRAELPRIASMGFDVLYLPPIHPIGREFRKGPNNSTEAAAGDPGSPWAIGSAEGGHTEIEPGLGTLADFAQLVADCEASGLELAMDLAYQCAPDHPWVAEHPEWFRHRPDGTIQYAENPPKKYQDIYPIDFETDDWEALWLGLKGVVDTWIERGVRIFRVDNPHTKAFPFWEWMLGEVHRERPDVLFLAEAFTRPKVMYRLAKLGFNQSYTYFTWRQERWELEEYLRELTSPPASDVFRPNFWPNTPDILTEQLQEGTRGTFVARLVLAATLSSSYGIYGPAFELMESVPAKPGSEEYLDSEKYQVRWRDLTTPHSLEEVVRIVNRARHEHPALQRNDTLRFHHVDNDRIIAYSKRSIDGTDTILTIVNLDTYWRQSGTVYLDLAALGIEEDETFSVRDLLGGATYQWKGGANFVELDPAVLPAHVLHVRGHGHRDEHDFDPYDG